jgi:hypothetical protein
MKKVNAAPYHHKSKGKPGSTEKEESESCLQDDSILEVANGCHHAVFPGL